MRAMPDKRPKVLFDGYFFDRAYGFGRYVRELIHAVDRHATDFDPVLVIPESAREEAVRITARTRLVTRKVCPFPIWEQWVVPWAAREQDCDLVHFPYQSTALLWPRSRAVLTIHDLMFLEPIPGSTPLKDRLAHYYRRGVFALHGRYARQLISVSDATRVELQKRLKLSSKVIYNVCEAFVSHNAPTEAAVEVGRFFLHRGDPGPHKNTRRVLAAFARVRQNVPDARLLIYGANVKPDLLEGTTSQGVELLGRITDERLASLYKAAVAVVVPSLEEGFGLAIIEAFGFGTPVITSNLPPMCDIAGEAGLLVDPLRVEQIQQAMTRLLEEPALRQDLLRRVDARYEEFSAVRAAAELARAYQSVEAQRCGAGVSALGATPT